MDRSEILRCADTVGAELYGEESSKRRTGRSFTYEQLMSFSEIIESKFRMRMINEISSGIKDRNESSSG